MNIKQRRAFYSIFIAAFIIIAPIVVLYTIGYRYNLEKGKVEQIGVLFADVTPTSANLWLNNELLPTTRPLRLSNLKPNYYTVKAEKEGYFTWEKNLEVKSKEGTLAYDIVLFKNSTPVLVDKDHPQTFALSPKNNVLSILNSEGVWLVDLVNDKKEKRLNLDSAPASTELTWSTDGKYLLVNDPQKQIPPQIIETNGSTNNYDLKKVTPNKFEKIIWHPSGNRLVGLTNGNLYEIDFLSGSSKLLASEVASFAATNGDIYLTKNLKDNTTVYKYSKLNFFQPLETLTTLPLENYQIKEYKNNFLSLNNSQNQIYLVDLSDKNQPLLRLTGISSIWGQGTKNNFLYYFDKSELWVFDPKIRKSYLLNRYDGDIQNVVPLYNVPYYVLQLPGRLLISELDDRDTRQTFTLFEGKDIATVIADKTAENIYFQYKLKDGYEIFKQNIQ